MYRLFSLYFYLTQANVIKVLSDILVGYEFIYMITF